MRLKYYITTIRQMKFNKSFVFFVVCLISVILLIILMYNKSLKPTLKTLSDTNAKTIAQKCSNEAVKLSISGIKYDDLITLQKDENGKITAIVANTPKMNEISSKVIELTQKEIEETKENYIKVPIGSFFGLTILGGHGVKINLKTLPNGTCNAKFKSSFEKAGINQTIHKIYIEITTDIETIAPFFSDTEEYKNEIAVSEVVLVGDIPTTYYDIQGVTDLKEKDTLNVTGNE